MAWTVVFTSAREAFVRFRVSSKGWCVQWGVSPTGVRARGPVAWIAVRRETDWSEAYRQSHRKDGERVSGPQHVRTDRLPREEQGPMAEPKEAGRRQDGVTHLADASGHIGGVTSAARRQRTRYATGEARLVPGRKPLEETSPRTSAPGKWRDDERVADGSVVVMTRGNARRAKGPCCRQSVVKMEGRGD